MALLRLALHWPSLDADVYVPSLMQGVFGTKLDGRTAWRSRHRSDPFRRLRVRLCVASVAEKLLQEVFKNLLQLLVEFLFCAHQMSIMAAWKRVLEKEAFASGKFWLLQGMGNQGKE